MARKAYGSEQQIRGLADWLGLATMGIGGLIAIAGAARPISARNSLTSLASALIAAAYYTEPTLFQYVLLPLGVGGTVYYLAHYDLTDWDQEARVRGFLRLFAMILLANSVVPETEPLADGMVSIVTVFGVLLFVVLTAVVDVLSDPDERDGGDSRDASGRTAGDGTGTPDRD
jgi:hypothetical protein